MISTHILDTTKGMPAAGVAIILLKKDGEQWVKLSGGQTNTDGRLSFDIPKNQGVYQLIFEVENYFKNINSDHFFMNTPVIFNITNVDRKYHVPLILNPYGYSTYRGS
jgi:5-hydroxyisourate hydrolase